MPDCIFIHVSVSCFQYFYFKVEGVLRKLKFGGTSITLFIYLFIYLSSKGNLKNTKHKHFLQVRCSPLVSNPHFLSHFNTFLSALQTSPVYFLRVIDCELVRLLYFLIVTMATSCAKPARFAAAAAATAVCCAVLSSAPNSQCCCCKQYAGRRRAIYRHF